MIIKKVALPPSEDILAAYAAAGIQLKVAGKTFKALCPFPEHADTTPSFTVYADGVFHCFGCGMHGSLEDLYKLFELDFRYHPSKIDLASIHNSSFEFVAHLRHYLEKRLSKAIEGIDEVVVFRAYDLFDQIWIDLSFADYTNRLDVAIAAKRRFNILLKELENERNESTSLDQN